MLKGDDKVFILSKDHFTSAQRRDHVDAQAITGERHGGELGPQRAKNCCIMSGILPAGYIHVY